MQFSAARAGTEWRPRLTTGKITQTHREVVTFLALMQKGKAGLYIQIEVGPGRRSGGRRALAPRRQHQTEMRLD